MTHWHVANENPEHGVTENVLCISMVEINAKNQKLDKVWTTDEVDTSIHNYMSEQWLWDNTHSDYSKNDVRQKTLAKFQEKKPLMWVLIKETILMK